MEVPTNVQCTYIIIFLDTHNDQSFRRRTSGSSQNNIHITRTTGPRLL